MMAERIAMFDSLGQEYERAFATFLAHTDQKDKAREWLGRAVGQLARRDVFLDAGAGNGKVTAWFSGDFARTIAIEPNPFLRDQLTLACPKAEVLASTILDAKPAAKADFVLLSHVLYYIPAADWAANVERLASFLSGTGEL